MAISPMKTIMFNVLNFNFGTLIAILAPEMFFGTAKLSKKAYQDIKLPGCRIKQTAPQYINKSLTRL